MQKFVSEKAKETLALEANNLINALKVE